MSQPQHTPYGGGGPSYGAAPAPGSDGHDPYSSPEAFLPTPPAPPQGGGYPGGHPGGVHPAYGPPPRRRRTGLVVAAVTTVVLVVGLGAVGFFIWPGWGATDDPTVATPTTADPATVAPSPTPTPDPTPTSTPTPTETAPTGGTINADGRYNGLGYSYDAPAGWTVAEDSGEYDHGMVVDGEGSDITVYHWGSSTGSCEADIEGLQIWVPGTVADLGARDIGGATATGTSLAGDEGEYYEIYCVTVGAVSYSVSLQTTAALHDSVQPLLGPVLDSWSWS